MKKIKVCYAISSLCEGPTYVLHNIVKYMDFEKFDVDIVTMIPEKDTSLIDEFKKYPLKIHQLAAHVPLSPWVMGMSLRKKIKQIDPEIVHVHCPRSRLLSPLIPSKYKKVETLHNNPELPLVLYGNVKGTLVKYLSTMMTRRMDLVIPCSESVGKKYDMMGIRNVPICNGSSMPVWNYNQDEKKSLRFQLRLAEDKKWFLYVGRFSEEKNPNVVIEAFEKLSNNKLGLVMLGNGRMWDKMKQHESDSILMPGFTHQVQAYMKAADYFISASDSEGMPNAVLEALATGIPLLLSDIAPHSEIINKSSEKIGVLYDQKDVQSLCLAIKEVVTLDHKVVSEAAHKVFLENYTAMIMSKKYQDMYVKLLED